MKYLIGIQPEELKTNYIPFLNLAEAQLKMHNEESDLGFFHPQQPCIYWQFDVNCDPPVMNFPDLADELLVKVLGPIAKKHHSAVLWCIRFEMATFDLPGLEPLEFNFPVRHLFARDMRAQLRHGLMEAGAHRTHLLKVSVRIFYICPDPMPDEIELSVDESAQDDGIVKEETYVMSTQFLSPAANDLYAQAAYYNGDYEPIGYLSDFLGFLMWAELWKDVDNMLIMFCNPFLHVTLPDDPELQKKLMDKAIRRLYSLIYSIRGSNVDNLLGQLTAHLNEGFQLTNTKVTVCSGRSNITAANCLFCEKFRYLFKVNFLTSILDQCGNQNIPPELKEWYYLIELGLDFTFMINYIKNNCYPVTVKQATFYITKLEKFLLQNPICFILRENEIQIHVFKCAISLGSKMHGSMWDSYFLKTPLVRQQNSLSKTQPVWRNAFCKKRRRLSFHFSMGSMG